MMRRPELDSLLLLAALLLAALLVTPATADDCSCRVPCPQCRHVCELTREKEKIQKHCWQVECKPICIPRVQFPWEKCCEPKGAQVKYVKVLVKYEYECERCRYKWTPVPADCGCGAPRSCAAASPEIPLAPPAPPAEQAAAPQRSTGIQLALPSWWAE